MEYIYVLNEIKRILTRDTFLNARARSINFANVVFIIYTLHCSYTYKTSSSAENGAYASCVCV